MSPSTALKLYFAIGLPLFSLANTQAQMINTKQSILESSRKDIEGKHVRIGLTMDSSTAPENVEKPLPKAVFLILPSVQVPVAATQPASEPPLLHEPRHYPMYRNRNALVQANITLAWMEWPSESNFGISGVFHPDFLKDIATVVNHLRNQGPKTPIILVGANGMSRTALAYALDRKETIDGMLVLSPYWSFDRHQKVDSLKSLKTLVLQDSSGQCMSASTIEVVDIAARAAFTYLPVNSKNSGRINDCSPRSANWLSSGDSEFTSTVSKWLDGQPLPTHLGPETIERSVSERVLLIPARSGTLETTIFTPKGKGPFPLVVFNHGDADTTTSWVKFKSRFVDTNVSAPFLRAGFAVAIPARPGVGRSDGYYSFSHYAINDGDPTYKARQHSVAVIAALEGLKSQSDLDLNRVLLAGQSAGGDAVMYMSTLQLEGVKGIINFAGGRSNHSANSSPNFENTMMISGWGSIGKQAIHPVLLVFAENDSRYSANTIRKSTEAFREAGGKADLLLVPPITGDGHFIHNRSDLWLASMNRFVKEVGILP